MPLNTALSIVPLNAPTTPAIAVELLLCTLIFFNVPETLVNRYVVVLNK